MRDRRSGRKAGSFDIAAASAPLSPAPRSPSFGPHPIGRAPPSRSAEQSSLQIASVLAYPSSDLEGASQALRMHPFEDVSSTNPTAAGFAGILNQDVVFHSPIFVQPVTGR